jgi:hypothetical protein
VLTERSLATQLGQAGRAWVEASFDQERLWCALADRYVAWCASS